MNKLSLSLATLAVAGTLSFSTIAPASADSAASTRNIILGAAALAGVAIEANVAQKNARANRVSGYLADGSTVYADGHVTDRNGNSYYPGNNGESVSCDNGRCFVATTNATNGNWNGNQNRNRDDRQNQNQSWNDSQNRNRNDTGNANRNDRQNGTWGAEQANRTDGSDRDDRSNR